MPDETPSDDDLARLWQEASALIGNEDADGDGEPDGLIQPAATAGEAPLIFERPVPKDAKRIVGGKGAAAGRATAKVVSPKTAKRAVQAEWRGVVKFVDWLYSYYTAADKLDLRLKNPRAHHEVTIDRRNRTFIGLGCILLLALITLYALGIGGLIAEAFLAFGALMAVGRNGKPILDMKAGEDIGMGEMRVQRAVARAVLGIDLDNEKYKDAWKHIIVRDGWTTILGSDTRTIRIGLPAPYNAARAKAREGEIAAALDLAVHQIRIVPDPHKENAGDFNLIIYGSDPWNVPATRLPCAVKPEQTDIWTGVDFGIDIDRSSVRLQLIGKSMLIGGLPEMGKTTTALTLMAYLALDPYVRLWIADAKGVDTTPLIPLAHRYIGASQEEMLAMLDELEAWGRKKLAALKEVSRVKFSRELCAMWRQIDPNHPLATVDVVYIDEARYYTNGNVQLQSKRIVSRLSQIIEMFRAAGIVVIIATQRPSTQNIPSEIRDLVRIRCAHACTTPTMSNYILGEGAAGMGYSSHVFDEEQPGVAWLRVLKSFIQVRPHLTEMDHLESACQYAFALRQSAGTLPEQIDASGMGDVPQILLDVEAVMNSKEWDKVPTNVLIPLLGQRSPVYDGIGAAKLSSRLTNWGVSPNSIGEWTFEDGTQSRNVRGYRLKWIQDAIQRAKRQEVK
jgi:hypothetical protein